MKTTRPFRYSPYPMAEYRIESLATCEVSDMMEMPDTKEKAAIWNLSWLSLPALDQLVMWGKTPKWFLHYRPTSGASAAIRVDVITDPVLMSKVVMHPRRFIAWFEREEQSEYACYDVLGGEKWVETVLTRAEEAAARAAEASERASSLELIEQDVPDVLPVNVFLLNGKRSA